MTTAKELLEENQWSRPSPSLLDSSNRPAPTCPICTVPKKRGHTNECWLGQAITELERRKMKGDTITPQELEIRGLNKQIKELESENKILRRPMEVANFNVDGMLAVGNELTKRDQQIKELKSELEGKMDGAHEVIYQLELQKRSLKERLKYQQNRANGNEAQLVWLAGWCKEKFDVSSNGMIGKEGWPNELVKVVAKVVDDEIRAWKALLLEAIDG